MRIVSRPPSRARAEATAQADDGPDSDTAATEARTTAQETRNKHWRLVALLLGLVAAACAIAFPFLPVVQDTARIVWPAANNTKPVNAPLTSYWAQDLQVDVPCQTVRSVDARTQGGGLLFASVPPARFEEGAGMSLRIDNGLLIATNRGQQVARQPLPPEGCDVAVRSSATHTQINVAGTPIFDQATDVRPRIVGIYSDVDSAKDPTTGLAVNITTDTRYQSTPTGLKIITAVVCALALLGCLIAVSRLDSRVARRAPRWAPIGWWRLNLRDITVIGALGAWVFIGAGTSDDGYILSMARVADQVGYLTNYHRWFGVAEAPFGWFYHVYELMAKVSVAPPWIRLPSFLLGVISWFLISREVMPRLGKEVRSSPAAGWAAAAVFLVWWMPFNNGVRPEAVAAVGSLLALCAVERALVTRRLLPVCLGLLTAALTLAATPTGMIAVAPFIVAARPLFQLLRQRAAGHWSHVLAPILASGTAVLVVMFADQTWATVQEATRLRTQVGPNLPWYSELSRYGLLFANSEDGSVARRFPVLLLILCTATCLVVLLRRNRIPGAALGPSRRLIGTVALFFLLLALTPTKWTHHFGAFAAVGAAMAALTALATSSTVLRSKRNRAAFLSGLLVVAALAATGPNAYHFVSKLGVPWYDKAPSVMGIQLSTVLLIAAAVSAIVAFIDNIRAQRPGPPPQLEQRGRALKFSSLALVVVCGLVAAGEFATMAKAIQKQTGSYSLGAANVGHLVGKSCNLSDQIMVERDPLSSMLAPLPAAAQTTVDEQKKEQKPPNELPRPEEGTGKVQTGFHTKATLPDDPIAEPPHGFKADTVPMWSSYRETDPPTGRLRTDWYSLPDDRDGKQLVLAVSAASGKATRVDVEYGEQTPEGIRVVRTQPALFAGAGSGGWRDVRLGLNDLPRSVTSARIVGTDDDFTETGYVAVTAPRVPTFTTMTEKVGAQPVYIDWPASFVYPCMNPVTSRDGISDIPAYRITALGLAPEGDWASSAGGGPHGWLEEVAEQPEVPSYLHGGGGRPWGQLLEIEPFVENTQPPTVIRGREVHSGLWKPGPGPTQPDGTQSTR